jgi:hypothetical protein
MKIMELSYHGVGNFGGIEPHSVTRYSSPTYSRSFLPNGCENPSVEDGESRELVEFEDM